MSEYDILKQDYIKGITYKSFDDFWETRIRPHTYFVTSTPNEDVPQNIKDNIKNNAEELYNKFKKDYPNV
jgi:hypothetical protein